MRRGEKGDGEGERQGEGKRIGCLALISRE